MTLENSRPDAAWWKWAAPILIVLCGLAAYWDCFQGQFIFDDYSGELALTAPAGAMDPVDPARPLAGTLSNRPVATQLFRLELATFGVNRTVFHTTNLLIHLGAGLLFYGIVRRNLSNKKTWGDRFERSAPWLAAACAVLWVVHPLNTQAVTYIVQRIESLAAFFYLVVIYCLIRFEQDKRSVWEILAIVACGLGVATKETAATAPILALLYDRTFLSGSFKEAFRQRWHFFAGLAVSWLVLLAMLLAPKGRFLYAGYGLGISAGQYGRTQLSVIAHYLHQVFWPTRLVFDEFGWPIADDWSNVGVSGWLTVALVLGTIVALWAKPRLGFVGAWVLIILAPTSSILPIPSEFAAEFRMYLPMMGIIALVVVLAWEALRKVRLPWAAALAVLAAVAMIALTYRRNLDYHSELGMWKDTVQKRPRNGRAWFNIGIIANNHNQLDAAIAAYKKAIEAQPNYHGVVRWLGQALIQTGHPEQALAFCDEQINGNKPLGVDCYFLRGDLRMAQNDWQGARDDFIATLRSIPKSPDVHYDLAYCYENLGQWDEARKQYQQTLTLSPGFRDASQRLMRLTMMETGS